MTPIFHLLHLCLALNLFLLDQVKPDPDPLQDYCVANPKPALSFYTNGAPCIDPALARSSHFSTSVLAMPGDTKANPFGFNVTLTNTLNLPGLNTMGLTMARVDIEANGLVPPHSHPRASEVIICLEGSVLVGFVDTSARLFTQKLRVGESFIFPKGLIHFIYNMDSMSPALAVSGMNSQNPGAQVGSVAMFKSKPLIPDEVLKGAFQINGQDIARIRRNLGGSLF
ncbi:germin-like protein subfamily 1 member 1 [Carica papaya]|uniref:germin-like protein subfamily 1 member 1 n=1 Tax=Carica papaya TaxID=3649 RepID=UPI000B8CF1F8|nr:germin-like protein subfamily 1 member 1 [Carica papaya]